ncbi:FAD-binding oxidoreductase [Nocardioides sp. SYSU DS0651]|uniref:FAD-binding oxidoreductase n=1 Tax=Nocardioides sp. SYSU DS0651 TaxID=3415955 RepID=UPI003F4B2CD4
MNALLQRLRPTMAGRLHTADDADLADHARPWNLAVRQSVLAVAEPMSVDEVVALVRAARDAGLVLAPQASGHGASGNTADTVLVRTHRMRAVTVDPVRRTAVVGAGTSWGEVQAAAARHGLTGLPGSSPVVTVTGYTLGGGLSWFGRRHGWASDGVVAIEVVDATGTVRRVTADSEPELFWALRGGGGDYAFVTSLEITLHPASELHGGRMTWPVAAAADVLATFREVAAHAPRELTTWFELLHFPGSEPMVAVDATYLGAEAEARALLAPYDAIAGRFADSRRRLGVDEIGTITAEPTDPAPGASRGELLRVLDDEAATALLKDPIAPLLTVQVRHLGGALAEPSDGPHGALEEPFALYLFGIPGSPEAAAAVRARQADLVHALGDRVTGRKPFSLLTPGDTPAAAFPAATLERLRAVKRRWDPTALFRSNYPV